MRENTATTSGGSTNNAKDVSATKRVQRIRLNRKAARAEAEQAKLANAGGKSKFENMLSGVDDYISRWRCGLDDLSSASRVPGGDSKGANSVWQSKEKSKVYSGKGDAIKALLLRNRRAFLKPPEERTNEEIGEVHNLISQTLQTEFFSKYNKSIQKDMAAAMKMEHFKANEVVFVQGDQPGNSGKYYIIAYGRVRIQVEQMAQLDEQEVKQQNSKTSPSGASKAGKSHETERGHESQAHHGHGHHAGGTEGGHGHHHHHHGGPETSPTQKDRDHIAISKITTRRQRRKSMIIASGSQLLTELQTGEGFGELALLSDRARAASAICAEETVLLTLDKSSYLSLMKNEHQRTQQVNLNAISTLRLFRTCTRGHIESIAPYFVIQTHNRGTMFNPDKDDHVSFIMKGHAVVAYGVQRHTKTNTKEVFDVRASVGHHGHSHGHMGGDTHSHAHAHKQKHHDLDKLGIGVGSMKSPVGSKSHSSHSSHGHMSGSMNSPHDSKPTKTAGHSKRENNLFVIRDLHEGDVFGETCVFQQFQRGYQIHAVTELEVLHISKVQFIDHIDEEVINQLREETAFRTSYYDGFYSLAQKRIEKRAEQLPELRDYLKDRAVLYSSVISKSKSVMEEYSNRKNFPLAVDKNGRRIHQYVRSYMIKT